jgi:large subunit ribosomal protein L31e
MAKKEEKEKKVILERVYNVPLRKTFQKAPRWKRTNRAVSCLRQFIKKHMKASNVKIGKYANLDLWKHGIKNPPHHIKVNCKKDEDGVVKVEIVGAPEEKAKPKKEKKPKEEIKVKDALGVEDAEKKEIKEEKQEKAKEILKEEIKELKTEHPKAHHPPKQAPAPKRVDTHPNAPKHKG